MKQCFVGIIIEWPSYRSLTLLTLQFIIYFSYIHRSVNLYNKLIVISIYMILVMKENTYASYCTGCYFVINYWFQMMKRA